jgi:hypothetical protein
MTKSPSHEPPRTTRKDGTVVPGDERRKSKRKVKKTAPLPGGGRQTTVHTRETGSRARALQLQGAMTKLPLRWAMHALLAVAGLYAVAGICLPGGTMSVFSGDIGLKFIQIDNLSRGHAWLEYAGASLDPASRLYPFGHRFVFRQAGRMYSVYLNPVIYLASLIDRFSGTWGCRLLPLACALGLLVATYVLAGRIGRMQVPAAGASALLLVATPLWFYG